MATPESNAERIARLEAIIPDMKNKIDSIHQVVCGNGDQGLDEKVRKNERNIKYHLNS